MSLGCCGLTTEKRREEERRVRHDYRPGLSQKTFFERTIFQLFPKSPENDGFWPKCPFLPILAIFGYFGLYAYKPSKIGLYKALIGLYSHIPYIYPIYTPFPYI